MTKSLKSMKSAARPGISRRRFLQQGSLATAAIATQRAWATTIVPTPASAFLSEFGYGDVMIASDLHESQLNNTVAVLMALNEDSLLKPLRQLSGLPAPGKTWADGTATIPLTITRRISTPAFPRAAPFPSGSQAWRGPTPSPAIRLCATKYCASIACMPKP